MDLTLDSLPAGNVVRAYGPDGARIGDDWHGNGVLVTRQRLESPWEIAGVAELDGAAASQLVRWRPEVVILGTGATLSLPAAAFSARIMAAGIGFEAMASDAACRTYNILAGENRSVLLALLPISPAAASPSPPPGG